MKTPDEIKRGLAYCSNDSTFCNAKCPYFNASSNGVDCATELHGNALAYIQQLERENAQKDERIKQYEQDTNELWFLSELDKQPVRLNCSARWISVEERLPEEDEDVLVFATSDLHAVIVVTSYSHNFYGLRIGGWRSSWEFFSHYYTITHWMPLPEPPEEGEG